MRKFSWKSNLVHALNSASNGQAMVGEGRGRIQRGVRGEERRAKREGRREKGEGRWAGNSDRRTAEEGGAVT
jgi:hypothetical protein